VKDARYFDNGQLVIFRRGDGNIFHLRTKLDGKYVWRSLRTTSMEEAIAKAWKLHHGLQALHEQGLPVTAKTFASVIDDYVAAREKSCRQGKTTLAMLRQVRRVVKFWREYAGSKPIHLIGDAELRDYVEWRRDYYANSPKPIPRNAKLNPADKTLQWEIMLGKAIIKWAHEKGLRGSTPLPTYTFTPTLKRVRPAFDLQEYRRLWRTLWKRVRTCPNERWRKSRELLRDYVFILANSGLRVGEANALKIRDLVPFKDELGRRNYRLLVDGKTGQREVVPRAGTAKFLERVLSRKVNAQPDDLLFAMPDGSAIVTLIDQFNAALVEAGLTHSSKGEKYTLYSLRHFYAVMGLRRGVSVYALRTNMGTSIQVIEAYYGKHATAPTFATALGN
jgi:integrase